MRTLTTEAAVLLEIGRALAAGCSWRALELAADSLARYPEMSREVAAFRAALREPAAQQRRAAPSLPSHSA